MNEKKSFYRKISYFVAIAILLWPLSLLSMPATPKNKGGTLAQMRNKYKLSQANLGKVDPASATMKLMTFGLRGLAVNWLWKKADTYKEKEDWDNLTVTLEQLAKLQPNYVIFWKFQAWNLSYNVSTEFDDYRDRYYYVRRGIKFLEEGTTYNKNNAELNWEMGWFIGHKIGRADEKKQYRRLFKADDDFHPIDLPKSQRDNWLVSKQWYKSAIDLFDDGLSLYGKKNSKVFFSSAAKSQISYATALNQEGHFKEAHRAWRLAGELWHDFGNRNLPDFSGGYLRLNDLKSVTQKMEKYYQKLTAMAPDLAKKIYDQKLAKTEEHVQKAFNTPAIVRTEEQKETVKIYRSDVQASPKELAKAIAAFKPELEQEAYRLANKAAAFNVRILSIGRAESIANFDYWKMRCEFEQTTDALAARKSIFEARTLFEEEVDIEAARPLFEKGFRAWKKVYRTFPKLAEDSLHGGELIEDIYMYQRLLQQDDIETLPADFPLWNILEKYDHENRFKDELEAGKLKRSLQIQK